MLKNKRILFNAVGLVAAIFGLFAISSPVSAFSVSPMKQKVVLTPGDSYTGEVTTVAAADDYKSTFHYRASIVPLTVDDNNNGYMAVYDQTNKYTDIVNWVTLSNGSDTVRYGDSINGAIEPGYASDLTYHLTIPDDAKGGGHYFAIQIKSVPAPGEKIEDNSIGIIDEMSILSVVYVEISGDVKVSGAIRNNEMPGFLLGQPITASFSAENNGNTHSDVTYFLQVFPLFSSEEIYTNEEKPEVVTVLPETTRYVSEKWDGTPVVGIFKVRQTVYYDSLDNEPSVTEKIVIVCPIWLIFVALFVIFALIFYFVTKAKARKKTAKRVERSA